MENSIDVLQVRSTLSVDGVFTRFPILQNSLSAEFDANFFGGDCTVALGAAQEFIDQTDANNLLKVGNECYIQHETELTAHSIFHGFIADLQFPVGRTVINIDDPLKALQKIIIPRVNFSADTIRLGDSTVVMTLVPSPADALKYIPDWTDAANDPAFTGGSPTGPNFLNRRTWKIAGTLKDDGTQDTDPDDPNYFPDKIIPPGLYVISPDTLDAIEFVGHTPVGNITIEFLIVYVEGTNEIEDIAMALVETALSLGGVEWVEGTHFDSTSTDYYSKTIWPSGITINDWSWNYDRGSLLDALTELFNTFAPPNYRPWWDHEYAMLRIQYVEITPHNVNTPYYQFGSYAYGRLTSSPPDPTTNDFVDKTGEIYDFTNNNTSQQQFHTKIIVEGINKYPKNILKDATITCLIAEWPADWTEDGNLDGLLDLDMGTFHRIWYDTGGSPPIVHVNKYYPAYYIDLGSEQVFDVVRFWGLNSRREFAFGTRWFICNDSPVSYDPDASWEPIHQDLFDRRYKPYEEVVVQSNFLKNVGRYILIECMPAKIHLKFRWAAGFTDVQLLQQTKVYGSAYIIDGLVGDTGEWNNIPGTGVDDGANTITLPSLFKYLMSRVATPDKIVMGQQSALKIDHSKTDTNSCAALAKSILYETLRDRFVIGISGPFNRDIKMFTTAKVHNPYWGFTLKAMVENLKINQGRFTADLVLNRITPWTGELMDYPDA